jgi:hypothetical protein
LLKIQILRSALEVKIPGRGSGDLHLTIIPGNSYNWTSFRKLKTLEKCPPDTAVERNYF